MEHSSRYVRPQNKNLRRLKSYQALFMTTMVWDLRKSVCVYSVTQLCLTLCSPMDCSPPGPSVNGIFQANWSGLPFPIPRDLNNPGIQPVSLTSPEFVGRFFTIRANRRKLENFQMWELKKKTPQNNQLVKIKKKIVRRGIKNILRQMKMETNHTKTCGIQ